MYRITYILGGEEAYRQKAMRMLLAALTMINADYVRETPDAPHPRSLHYEPTLFETDDWNDGSAIKRMGGGACCEDAAAYFAGWIQAKYGIQAWPKLVMENGKLHTIVSLPNGRTFDPSVLIGRTPPKDGECHVCNGLSQRPAEQRITFVTDLFRKQTPVIGFDGQPTLDERSLAHRALNIMLNALFLIDCLWLRLNPQTPSIYKARVKYEEEPLGREDWQDIPSTIARRVGDCEDLATWRAAEYVVRQGIQARPTFIWRVRPSGAYLYHILTHLPNGTDEDPSRALGMGAQHLSHSA